MRNLTNLLYKAESRLSIFCHAANSVNLAWIDSGLDLCGSCGLWHEQVYFYKFLRPLNWPQEGLKEAAVQFWFHFASHKFAKLCNFVPT